MPHLVRLFRKVPNIIKLGGERLVHFSFRARLHQSFNCSVYSCFIYVYPLRNLILRITSHKHILDGLIAFLFLIVSQSSKYHKAGGRKIGAF